MFRNIGLAVAFIVATLFIGTQLGRAAAGFAAHLGKLLAG